MHLYLRCCSSSIGLYWLKLRIPHKSSVEKFTLLTLYQIFICFSKEASIRLDVFSTISTLNTSLITIKWFTYHGPLLRQTLTSPQPPKSNYNFGRSVHLYQWQSYQLSLTRHDCILGTKFAVETGLTCSLFRELGWDRLHCYWMTQSKWVIKQWDHSLQFVLFNGLWRE